MDVQHNNIKTLQGLERFPILQQLDIRDNKLVQNAESVLLKHALRVEPLLIRFDPKTVNSFRLLLAYF